MNITNKIKQWKNAGLTNEDIEQMLEIEIWRLEHE